MGRPIRRRWLVTNMFQENYKDHKEVRVSYNTAYGVDGGVAMLSVDLASRFILLWVLLARTLTSYSVYKKSGVRNRQRCEDRVERVRTLIRL